MKSRLKFKETIAVASMLFGLFFGAGNLIFPVYMGQLAGSRAWIAALGFIVTGVGLPLLGVAAVGSSGSEGLREMSGRVGKGWSVFFTCAMYLTIGPFFAIPRCATTSFTIGVEPLLGGSGEKLGLVIFSLVFFALVLLLSLRPGKILVWVGKIINPLFLAFLGILILASFIRPMGNIAEVVPDEAYTDGAFFSGFLEGYNTMDAIAALAFGIVIVRVVRQLGVEESSAIAGCTLKAGIFSCVLMGLVYALITLMGARSRGILSVCENGGAALAQIAEYYFGGAGQIFLAVTVFLACLKTSVGLVTSCAETFSDMFPKIGYRAWTIGFTLFSLIVSNAGLDLLIEWAVPVLMFLYPLAITLILLSLFGRSFGYDRCVYIPVTILTAAAAVLDLLRSLPDAVRAAWHVDGFVSAVSRVLPFSGQGLGWICPALLGLVIGLVLRAIGKKKLRAANGGK